MAAIPFTDADVSPDFSTLCNEMLVAIAEFIDDRQAVFNFSRTCKTIKLAISNIVDAQYHSYNLTGNPLLFLRTILESPHLAAQVKHIKAVFPYADDAVPNLLYAASSKDKKKITAAVQLTGYGVNGWRKYGESRVYTYQPGPEDTYGPVFDLDSLLATILLHVPSLETLHASTESEDPSSEYNSSHFVSHTKWLRMLNERMLRKYRDPDQFGAITSAVIRLPQCTLKNLHSVDMFSTFLAIPNLEKLTLSLDRISDPVFRRDSAITHLTLEVREVDPPLLKCFMHALPHLEHLSLSYKYAQGIQYGLGTSATFYYRVGTFLEPVRRQLCSLELLDAAAHYINVGEIINKKNYPRLNELVVPLRKACFT